MSRALVKRIEGLERRLMMRHIEEEEILHFDWDGPPPVPETGRVPYPHAQLTFLKFFDIAQARCGITLGEVVDRSWCPTSCSCETCAAYDAKIAPVVALIEKARERRRADGD